MEAMIFGLCLFTSDLIAVFLVIQKRAKFSLVFELLSLALTWVVLHFWRNMLVQSGKSTELLGFHAYPAVLIIVGILALTALVCLIAALVQIVLHKDPPEPKP